MCVQSVSNVAFNYTLSADRRAVSKPSKKNTLKSELRPACSQFVAVSVLMLTLYEDLFVLHALCCVCSQRCVVAAGRGLPG